MRRARIAVVWAVLFASLATAAQLYAASPRAGIAVAPQYGSTHVYVAPEDFDRFISSFVATFGGSQSKQGVFQATPTPSQTMSQLALTPVGTLSVFGFKTPIPYPFGIERTGYLVSDMAQAIRSARAHGAAVIVDVFADPIGRDAIIEWPGGVHMQLYWHTTVPHYPPLESTPENRVYVSPDRVDSFVRDFEAFAGGRTIADDRQAPGIEVGRPGEHYRSILIESPFGKINAFVTDGHLPYPYGRELAGYEVKDLTDTLSRAQSNDARIIVEPYRSRDRESALIQFPGGYIAEVHTIIRR